MHPIEDDLGITYLIENPQQFWSELEDILQPPRQTPTLQQLDSTLKHFLDLCITYHEQFLQSPLQLEHACGLLLDSELFVFHSERMCDILTIECQTNTDPHSQFINYHVLLCYGCRKVEFFRSQPRWQPLIPLLMDHVHVDIDSDIEESIGGLNTARSISYSFTSTTGTPIPIEAKLRTLGVRLLYEVCRVQKFSLQQLRIYDDSFIEYLFELVEHTRHMADETFNYTVIKLIVALNEQFMVATLSSDTPAVGSSHHHHLADPSNRVLRVLMGRLGSSKTFGENMIFMLNRAEKTPEDLCMQLLVLKILYLLFSTQGTSEYFYTNDLQVLVDVFLRELVNLDEESESLRHTYLRVLHPLLTRTQLRDIPYKRHQIVYALESLLSNSNIREVNPTTKRLVERCLSGEWCVQLRKAKSNDHSSIRSSESVDSQSSPSRSQLGITSVPASSHLHRSNSKTLRSSKSMEFKPALTPSQKPLRLPDNTLRPNNTSNLNLAGATPAARTTRNGRGPSTTIAVSRHEIPSDSDHPMAYNIPILVTEEPQSLIHSPPSEPPRRRAAPAPPKRRKPPAIPVQVGRSNGGATISAIQSSSPTE